MSHNIRFRMVIAGIFQTGLWYYACEAALAAAQEGDRAASAEHGTATAGTQAAQDFLDRTANDLVDGVEVSGQRTTTRATVTGSGRSLSLIPGFAGFPFSQTAAFEVERLT